MKTREFIINAKWLAMIMDNCAGMKIVQCMYSDSVSYELSIPNITDEDLLWLKLRYPGFVYREV